jgi:hypothetical protein
VLGELLRVSRFHLGEGLRDDFKGVIVAPALVLRRFAVFLGEGLNELL